MLQQAEAVMSISCVLNLQKGGLEVENVACTPMQDRTGKEGGEQGSAVVSISCFSAICGSKGTVSLLLLLWNLL